MTDRKPTHATRRRHPFMHGSTLGGSAGTAIGGFGFIIVGVFVWQDNLLLVMGVLLALVGITVFELEIKGYGWS